MSKINDNQNKKNTEVVSVTYSNIRANLAKILQDILNDEVVDFQTNENGFIIKFDSARNYSENEFPIWKEKICAKKNDVFKNQFLDQFALGSCIPEFFQFEKVAQEDFLEKKVQKIVCVAFLTKKELDDYNLKIEALKKNDHRVIGQTQNLFYMIPESPGSVFWLPKGWKIFKKMEAFIRKYGYDNYQEVKTPFVMSNEFWKKSGHMAAFKKNMMFVNMGDCDHEESALKPMNCPGHIEIFKMKNRSYKELPYRIAEFGSCHRYEPSGSLHGLMRVRSLTIDDGHIFCSKEQIQSETENFLKQAIFVYKKLGFDNLKIALSTRPENYLGNLDEWNFAEFSLEQSLKNLNLEYEIAKGEGAFYGPKIEMHVKDSMQRSWQLGTIQLDFVLPERFELNYIDSNNEKAKLCMLHRAILGSIERFIGVLLEHTQGKLPLFLSPLPIMICTVVTEAFEYAKEIKEKLDQLEIISEIDAREETLSYKIREHRLAKIPIIVILGKDELNNRKITVEYMGNKIIYEFERLNEIMRLFSEA